MNIRRTSLMLIALLAAAAVHAADAPSTTVFGANGNLADGARALRIGDFDEGIRLTLEGLKVEKRRFNRAKGLSNLCAGYLGLLEHVEALNACDAALSLNEHNWHIYNNRALALLGLGRIHEARGNLKAALALNPGSPKLGRTRAWIDARASDIVLAENQ